MKNDPKSMYWFGFLQQMLGQSCCGGALDLKISNLRDLYRIFERKKIQKDSDNFGPISVSIKKTIMPNYRFRGKKSNYQLERYNTLWLFTVSRKFKMDPNVWAQQIHSR